MCQRLAQRERRLMPVEGPSKQDRQQLYRGARFLAGSDDLLAASLMMSGKRVNPLLQAEEWQVVRRQNECFGRDQCAQLCERAQKERERVAVRLVSMDADIRRD